MNSELILMNVNETDFFARLGRRMAELRKQQGFTQVQLANMLDVKQYVIASYETGRRRPSAALLPEIARALGISVEELLGIGSGRKKPGPVPKLHRQLEKISTLPKEQQKSIMQVLDMALTSAS